MLFHTTFLIVSLPCWKGADGSSDSISVEVAQHHLKSALVMLQPKYGLRKSFGVPYVTRPETKCYKQCVINWTEDQYHKGHKGQ